MPPLPPSKLLEAKVRAEQAPIHAEGAAVLYRIAVTDLHQHCIDDDAGMQCHSGRLPVQSRGV